MTCEFCADTSPLSLLSIYPKIKFLISNLLEVTRWEGAQEDGESVIAVYVTSIYQHFTPSTEKPSSLEIFIVHVKPSFLYSWAPVVLHVEVGKVISWF